MPHDRPPCPSVAVLTRALGFARPKDFARASSRSTSSLVPPKAGRSARAQAVGGRRSRRTAGGGGEVFRPPCPLRLASVARHTASFSGMLATTVVHPPYYITRDFLASFSISFCFFLASFSASRCFFLASFSASRFCFSAFFST